MSSVGVIPAGAVPAPAPPRSAVGVRVADPSRPVVVVGGGGGAALLSEVLRQTSPHPGDGYTTRVIAVGDFGDFIADEPRLLRLESAGALREWLLTPARLGTALPTQVVGAEGAACAEARDVLHAAQEAQQALHARLRAGVLGYYSDKDRAFWRGRYRGAMSGAHGPTCLRVLIPISRYSTFVRHSADDLAAALGDLGHRAEVLTEPDPHSKLTTPAYLGSIDALKPDLVVLMNHTRRQMGQAVPPGVPLVCWVQDRMAHLFDPACGAAQGELDFLFGHLHPDLFSHFNYPRERRGFAFVPASERRFAFGPAPERFDAEIAYVSHQSETPERMHARLAPMFAAAPAVARCLEGLHRAAGAWLDRAETDRVFARSDRNVMVREALASVGLERPDERLVRTVFGNYLVPMMERMARHRALEWARRVCERRGWRLRLHGRGWDRHPTLAPYAAGEAAHGDGELARLYHSSVVHLHASMNTNAHQRVYECALSGGLMLRRGPSPDLDIGKAAMMRAAALRPSIGVDEHGAALFEARESDELPVAGYFRAVGREPVCGADGAAVYRRTIADAVRRMLIADTPEYPMMCLPDFAFPDGHETLFESESQLERLVERAITDPGWRAATIQGHRRAALEHCTYSKAARRMLELVGAGLGAFERGEMR